MDTCLEKLDEIKKRIEKSSTLKSEQASERRAWLRTQLLANELRTEQAKKLTEEE